MSLSIFASDACAALGCTEQPVRRVELDDGRERPVCADHAEEVDR